ncbi:LysR family transcriptional regulator [Arenibacterium sp. CAU 1754]
MVFIYPMNLLSFDLNLLRVLDALLQEGSTVRAGARIGLSQPAVSAALGRLRMALDDPLFVRHGQRLEPTEYARALADPLRRTLDDIETMISGPGSFDPMKAVETFKLSGSDFFAEMLMPALGDHLSRVAPNVRVQLVDLVPDNYVDTLENYEVDIALIPKMEHPSWVDWQPLFRSGFVMIARRGHPRLARARLQPGDVIPIDLFCDLGHILFSPEGNLRTMGDAALAAAGRERRVVMTMPVFYGVSRAVAESDHVALLPEQLAARLSGSMGLDIYEPPMPIAKPEIGMIWHKRASNAPAHRWIRDQIAQLMEPLNND